MLSLCIFAILANVSSVSRLPCGMMIQEDLQQHWTQWKTQLRSTSPSCHLPTPSIDIRQRQSLSTYVQARHARPIVILGYTPPRTSWCSGFAFDNLSSRITCIGRRQPFSPFLMNPHISFSQTTASPPATAQSQISHQPFRRSSVHSMHPCPSSVLSLHLSSLLLRTSSHNGFESRRGKEQFALPE